MEELHENRKPGNCGRVRLVTAVDNFFLWCRSEKRKCVFYSRKLQRRELKAGCELLQYLVLFLISVTLHIINKVVL